MAIIFTKHALQQVKSRKLDKTEIITTLNSPDKQTEDDQGNLIAQKVFGTSLLRVFYLETGTQKIIITAYKTSKIKKYI